jgi:predicted ABC-type ATPase
LGPWITIIAGPNGAGKTTFARQLLSELDIDLDFNFVNADEIARSLLKQGVLGNRDMLAGRAMLKQLNHLVEARSNLMFETTLSTLSYAPKISQWKSYGYGIELHYLRLPTAEVAIQRVADRFAAGGHNVPEADIRRRFGKSVINFELIYKGIVDAWWDWDTAIGEPTILATGVNDEWIY